MTTTRRQYEQIMTEYSRLLHPNSSESETSAVAPAAAITQNRKPAFNSSKKKRSQRPESLVPTAHIYYLQSPMLIECGDWVVRLRDGDPAAMTKLDESDIWDGPFPVVELPPAAGDGNDNIVVSDPAASPVKETPRVKLRFPQGSKGDPWTSVNRLIPVYPDPPRPEGAAPGGPGVIFHLRKGSATFVELQRFHPRGKKEKELFIVGRLRDRRLTADGAETEYLVHWAGWPSEDDSWEKVNGIPESFREEYEKAKSGKKASTGSKTPKAKIDKLSVAKRNSSASAIEKDKAPGAGKKTSASAATVETTSIAPVGQEAGVEQGTVSSLPAGGATTRGQDNPRRTERRTTPPPPTQAPAKTQTPKNPLTYLPNPKKPPIFPISPIPAASRVLGKRNRNVPADEQTSPPAEIVVGKRRRVASAKSRTGMA